MALDREVLFDALFKRLSAVPGLRTAARKFKPLASIAVSDMPAMFMMKGGETCKPRRGLPPVWLLEADLLIYIQHQDGPNSPGPSTELNNIITGIEAALEMTPQELAAMDADPNIPDDAYREIKANSYGTTLGGLCSHCFISGTIQTDEGSLSDQAAAAIPIEILTF